MGIITLKEYAIRHGKEKSVPRKMAKRGSFKTAYKVGRDWVIDEDEPYPDNRIKTGQYIGWRKPKNKSATDESSTATEVVSSSEGS